MALERQRIWVGCAIIFGSIVALFWWGFHFGIFGTPIRPTGPYFGFFGCMLLGVFGVGYIGGGVKSGIGSAGTIATIMVVAILIGVALGNYR